MEHKKRKMFAAVAVIMLCAVAIVGVGYAYTAQTNNSGNNAYSEYVTLNQTGAGAYKFVNGQSVYYNTVNTAYNEWTYSLTDSTVNLDTNDDGNNDYKAVKIGNTFKIIASQVNGTVSTLDCAISFESGTVGLTNGWNLIFDLFDGTSHQYLIYAGHATPAAPSTPSTWVGDDNVFDITVSAGAYNEMTVNVYYGLEFDNTTQSIAPADKPLNNVTIGFTATRALVNYFTVDFTDGNEPVVGKKLSEVVPAVYVYSDDSASAVPLTVGSQYTIAWTVDGATVAPGDYATTEIDNGHTYVLKISGVAETLYAGKVSEFRFVIPAA